MPFDNTLTLLNINQGNRTIGKIGFTIGKIASTIDKIGSTNDKIISTIGKIGSTIGKIGSTNDKIISTIDKMSFDCTSATLSINQGDKTRGNVDSFIGRIGDCSVDL